MTRVRTKTGVDRRPRLRGAAVLACALLAAAAAWAQEPQPTQPAPPMQPAAPVPFQPGFIDVLERLLGDSKTRIDEQFKTTTDAAKGAVDAARDAARAASQATDTIVGLPGTRVVNGRERCTVSANGAADCAVAANALCKSKGFGNGRGLEINTAQKCPAWVWLSGKTPPEGTCTNETFVTRAACQ